MLIVTCFINKTKNPNIAISHDTIYIFRNTHFRFSTFDIPNFIFVTGISGLL